MILVANRPIYLNYILAGPKKGEKDKYMVLSHRITSSWKMVMWNEFSVGIAVDKN